MVFMVVGVSGLSQSQTGLMLDCRNKLYSLLVLPALSMCIAWLHLDGSKLLFSGGR